MDFKPTKGTAQKSTDEPWRTWVRASITERPSAEFSRKKNRSRGAELRAAEGLRRAGWKILFHDVEIRHVQVDLVVRAPDGTLTIVEVKMQTEFGVAHLSSAQARRLLRVGQFLAEFEPVQMRVAFIRGSHVMHLPVDGLTGF